MKHFLRSLAFSPLIACGLPVASAAEPVEAVPEVLLETQPCGCECVMLFAKVGERFEYPFGRSANDATIVVGSDVEGQPSQPPQGLRFDHVSSELSGIPRRSGFHEFVVLETDKGKTRERVVLIDVQGPSFGSGGMAFASYFSGGVR